MVSIANVDNASAHSIAELTTKIRVFGEIREWGAFHSPRNVLLALVGEVGELAAEFQWTNDADVDSNLADASKRTAVEGELADIATYLFRLCDVLGVDLARAVTAKLELNELRYPVKASRGSSAKYSAYE